MCLAFLHIPLREFYDYTPIEIDYAFKAYVDQQENSVKLSWEQTRTQIYFGYLYAPSRKRKVTYNQFKKDFLPFSFDEEENVESLALDDEQFALMDNFIENMGKEK